MREARPVCRLDEGALTFGPSSLLLPPGVWGRTCPPARPTRR